ncbi:hypothetical protein E4Z66_09175 [Aliishimia ponticola]|uniref:Uncharacterized protein n=1 Tax=Aliishimia ponticola TaxID=2499833 RepID=A0A4S4NDA6_9RHOB|nr:hypothetical protein [Aliishimia ponticola]THH37476.1 hypothetical protein E4Z66_09175 [Aliishimia ponticola]
MVALKKYARIEASGLWRPAEGEQRRDVIAVLGDATLTIKTGTDQALAHWSIAAIDRANPGKMPARFHPDGDPGEELELPESEAEMIDAIEKLRRAVERARPRPGRLRLLGILASLALVAYMAIFWLPGALLTHTLSVVPPAGRAQIGQALFGRISRVTGPACGTSANMSSLARLGSRLDTPRLAVMRGGFDSTLMIPGGRVLLSRKLVEDFEEPDVVAGFILAERARAAQEDPLRRLLDFGGVTSTFRLLTTGRLSQGVLDAYAEHLLVQSAPQPAPDQMLPVFAAMNVGSTAYAYALDVTGETVLPLIEGDPMRGKPPVPLVSDADWLRIQAICGA